MQDDAEFVDRILHIEEMKEKLQELSGGQALIGGTGEQVSLELEEVAMQIADTVNRHPKLTHHRRPILTHPAWWISAPFPGRGGS